MIADPQDSNSVQQREETALRHPLFQTPGPPSPIACLDAIDQAAYVVELFCYLDLGRDSEGGLSPEAQNGHFWLSAMLQSTLLYASNRLGKLYRERVEQERKEASYLSALLKSLSTLNDDVHDSLLNTLAIEVKATRPEVDQFIAATMKR